MKSNINIKEKTNYELIQILETPEDYQAFLIEMAEVELEARKLSKQEKAKIAEEMYWKKSEEILNKTSDYENIELPTSRLIPEPRQKLIFKKVYDAVMKRKKIFKGNAGGYIA